MSGGPVDSSSSPPRSVGIDVLRGVAVGLVMARHAWPEVFSGAGVVGVVMFFALSGHLITGSLRTEFVRTGVVRFGQFYLRRVRRLVPALVVMLVGFTVVTWVFDPLGDRGTLPGTWLVALTWTTNLPLGVEYSEAAFHLWTLAGEEQFYLVWPLLMWVAWHTARTVPVLVALAGVALTGIGVTWLWLGDAADVAYALPTSWAVCFVIGGAARLYVPDLTSRAWLWAVPVALTGLGMLAVLPVRGHWLTYLLVAPAVAGLTVLLVAVLRTRDLGPYVGPLAWLGTRSYAAYLWNYPLSLWLRPHDDTGVWAGPLAAVLTLLLADLSWRYVEQRFVARPRQVTVGDLPKVVGVGGSCPCSAVT